MQKRGNKRGRRAKSNMVEMNLLEKRMSRVPEYQSGNPIKIG